MTRMIKLAVMVLVMLSLAGTTFAAEDVGAVVGLRGGALIERETKIIEAKLKDGIQLKDSVETKERARAKMLFIDDSVLTMDEKSKMVIKEFLYSKDKGGRSIFNLIDGKMRSVVGKTEFEVQTPTVVAAARGTVFDCETGEMSGKSFTTCTSYEGIVEIRSTDPRISGKVSLRPGMTITVISGQALPAPTLVPAAPTSAAGAAGGAAEILPPVDQQPIAVNSISPPPPPSSTTPPSLPPTPPSPTTPSPTTPSPTTSPTLPQVPLGKPFIPSHQGPGGYGGG